MTRTGTTLSRDPRRLIRCTLSGVAATLAVVGTAALAITPGTPTATKNYGAVVSGLPLQFEPNVGLSGDDVEFSARGAAYAISLNRQGAEFSLGQPATQPTASPDVLRLAVVGTRPAATPSAEGPLPGRVNYLIGNDPSKWRTDVPTYAKVRYSGVYPGIDLVYYGTQGRLEYDFAVAPGANAGKIRLAFQGADRLRLDGNGNLEVSAHGRTLAFERPVAYQLVGERHVPIAATYRIQGNAIKFDIGPYDHSRALIIDPVLSYFSYLGGAAADNVGAAIPSSGNLSGQAAAVDGAGHLYVVGYTYSSNFPTKGTGIGAIPAKYNGQSIPWVFVTEVAADATSLVYSTYIGGSFYDYGYGIAVDSKGSAYITGSTSSADFPVTTGAFQTICGPNGGPGGGSPTVTTNCLTPQNVNGGNAWSGAFVAKLNPTGNGLVYSTFLGSVNDSGRAIAVDSAYRAYVAGSSPNSGCQYQGSPVRFTCFPTTTGAVLADNRNGGFAADAAFVSVLDPTGSTLLYSTLFADTRQNVTPAQSPGLSFASADGTAVAVDAAGNFYLAGYTNSGFLPTTVGAYQQASGPLTSANGNNINGTRGFVAKFTPVGGQSAPALVYGTYLGGLTTPFTVDQITGLAVDAAGDAYLAGYSTDPTFPVTSGAFQTGCGGGSGNCIGVAFLAELNPSGTKELAATYYGLQTGSGDGISRVGALAIDASANIYLTGEGASGIPQVNPIGTGNGGGGMISPFVAKFAPTLGKLLFASVVGTGGQSQLNSGGLAVDGTGNIYLAGTVNAPPSSAATPGVFQSTPGGSTDGFVAKIAPTVPTTTTLSVAPASSIGGSAVTFTATVAESPGSAVPTGTVTFKNGATALGTGTLNSSGVATFTTSSLGAGTYTVTATYGGDSSNSPSSSGAASETVIAATTTTLSIAPASATTGAGITFTATVVESPGSTIPTGTVTFTNGTTTLGSGTLNASGVATYSTSTLAAASYSVTASYGGDTLDNPSKSPAVALTVQAPAMPTVSVSVAPTSITVGSSATITWSSTNATSCTASGSWSGNEATSGTQVVTPTATGSPSYSLACTGAGGTATGSATRTVSAKSTGGGGGGGGGGGALDAWTLAGLGALILARRRRQATPAVLR